MKSQTFHRRQILKGAGAALPLPFLPSLFPRLANGAQPVPPDQRFLAVHVTQHGAISPENMYPPNSALTGNGQMAPGHALRYGDLVTTQAGNNVQLSPVLNAPAADLSPTMVSKMNVMRGFDIPYYIGHHAGGHLGNFLAANYEPGAEPRQNLSPWPSVDQTIAYSPKFYSNLDGIIRRSIKTGHDFGGTSYSYSNPTAGSGTIQRVFDNADPRALFNLLFVPPDDNSEPSERRTPIVDRVLESYRRLRTSNRRLSVDDRQRLDDHISRLSELERTVNGAGPNRTASCGEFAGFSYNYAGNPGGLAPSRDYYRALNDVIAMSFACGTSRIATIWNHSPFVDFTGNWHQDIAHQHGNPSSQALLVEGLRNTFEYGILDLAQKLDAIELFSGTSVLDASLLMWSQESGPVAHESRDMPMVTFGCAGNFFRTGNFVDFRSQQRWDSSSPYTGVLVRQWLANVALSMGLAPSDFELDGSPGYGDPWMGPGHENFVHPNIINRASDPLPVITA